jgi:hypothetical protein
MHFKIADGCNNTVQTDSMHGTNKHATKKSREGT